MKTKLHVFAAVVSAAFLSFADADSDAVIDVLDSRFSDNPMKLASASRAVADAAERGKPLQRFLVAVFSRENDAPAAFKISDAKRDEYFKTSRGLIEYSANKRSNPLAVYLLAIDRNDKSLLDKAVELGNVQAMTALATMTLSSICDDPDISQEDYDAGMRKVFSLYSKVADSGNASGINNLGVCYRNGLGCEKNLEKAFELFKLAVDKGNPDAMNNIAEFYRTGLVVAEDRKKAVKCFSQSAATGNLWGQFNYSLCLLRGEGVAKNAPCAVELMLMIAKKGVPEAMDVLSGCYERGDGVEADSRKALVWMLKAKSARGDESAAKWLEANGEAK